MPSPGVANPRATLLATLLAAILTGAPHALAQANRPWVDPPADLKAPSGPPPPAQPPGPAPEAAPAPGAAQPAAPPPAPAEIARDPQPERKEPAPAQAAKADPRAEDAKNLTIRYLRSWSAATEDSLDATAAFYAPRVLFHGRLVNLRTLMREKRRFVRRWPERRYTPRQDTIQVACEGDACAVQALFDFSAAHPGRGRQAQGTGALQLAVTFVDGRPVIATEASMVLGLGTDGAATGAEESDDD
ncbi:nuclear transport factor 2 family protein [Microvirga thermotolerans]|uniref:DUF4440 domain-containing protein n=1 Tax=Microvirga thermotolerans TaxID=2651334 RepID=A0A5P9JZM9_9HYPH|nr:nuclear transport factor 2 family protein [Microvirga thermotolerans]QFU17903.1 hypothetical protein GDR74_17720 [Microvirga thermotolerans]